jgi:lipid II:glycine glycyltransferase (peptidoglycan interpeptide bridge formation enzyme)
MKSNLHLEWIKSGNNARLKEWDEFLLNSPRGHYCQLSTWLKSYCVFSCDFEVLVARNDRFGPIIGGAGLLYFDKRIFRIMTMPIGPIVDVGQEDAAGPILQAALDYAKGVGVTALQLHFPCSTEYELPALLPGAKLPDLPHSQAGIAIKHARADNEMLWIDLPACLDDDVWRDQALLSFSQNHRRKIRQTERNGLEAFEASTEAELRDAYSVIEENARLQGYSVRTWRDIGETLVEQVNSRQAIMIVARHRGRNVGANYGALAGRRYTYVLGGITNEGRELKAGYFLQWKAMNKAKRLGFSGYDLASTTNQNVLGFKGGFRPRLVQFVKPRYFVFSQLRYKAFRWAYPKLREHSEPVLKIMRAVRSCLNIRSNSNMLWLSCFIAMVDKWN